MDAMVTAFGLFPRVSSFHPGFFLPSHEIRGLCREKYIFGTLQNLGEKTV